MSEVSFTIYLSLYEKATGWFRLEDLSTWSKPLLRAVMTSGLSQATEGLVQLSFKHIQGRWVHNPPGQPLPGVYTTYTVKSFLYIQSELSLLQFVASGLDVLSCRKKKYSHETSQRERVFCHSSKALLAYIYEKQYSCCHKELSLCSAANSS